MKKTILLSFIFWGSSVLCMYTKLLQIKEQNPLDFVWTLEDAVSLEAEVKGFCNFLLQKKGQMGDNQYLKQYLKNLIDESSAKFDIISAIRETCQDLRRPSSARDAMPLLKKLGFVVVKQE